MIKNGRICYDTNGQEITKGERFRAVQNETNKSFIIHYTEFPSPNVQIIQHPDGRVEQKQEMCDGFISNGQQINPDFIAKECKIYDIIECKGVEIIERNEQ